MNNFKQLRSLLHFDNVGDFYFIQVIKRRKENPDLPKSEKLIKSYSVFSLEDYDGLEPRIIETCVANNARAYMRMNKRNSAQVAIHMIASIAHALQSKQTNHLHKMYDSAVGSYPCSDNKTWLVDIDTTDVNEAVKIRMFIRSLAGIDAVKAMVKTVNGYHLVSKPFNRMLFTEMYPDIDIHKDNPTLLYYKVLE